MPCLNIILRPLCDTLPDLSSLLKTTMSRKSFYTCDGPNKSLQGTLHRGEGPTTCSCTKGLYFEDLKLRKEEEGGGGER
jgi:hypothetical protein